MKSLRSETFLGQVDCKAKPKAQTRNQGKNHKQNPIYYTGYRSKADRRRINDNEIGKIERAVTAVRILDGQERRISMSAKSAFERLVDSSTGDNGEDVGSPRIGSPDRIQKRTGRKDDGIGFWREDQKPNS